MEQADDAEIEARLREVSGQLEQVLAALRTL
jgi:hypothetical protein